MGLLVWKAVLLIPIPFLDESHLYRSSFLPYHAILFTEPAKLLLLVAPCGRMMPCPRVPLGILHLHSLEAKVAVRRSRLSIPANYILSIKAAVSRPLVSSTSIVKEVERLRTMSGEISSSHLNSSIEAYAS